MPGPLIIFFALIGLGGVSALTDSQSRVWDGPDKSSHSMGKVSSEASYNFSTNYPFQAIATKDLYGQEACRVTLIATHNHKRPLRLQLDGVEQELGTGWMADRTVKVNKVQEFRAVFLNPIGGAVMAIRTTSVHCIQNTSPARDQALYDERGLRGYTPPGCPCAKQ